MADGGRYRGSRDSAGDYFDDVMGDNSVPSMFQTDMGGIGEYEGMKERATEQGLVITMHCRPPGCGKPREVTISWGELFLVANLPQTGRLPQGWQISQVNQAAYPDLNCNCGQTVAPMITPDWASRQVELAMNGGLITQEQLARDPQVMAVVGSVQQMPAQMQGPPGGYPRR